MTTPGDLNDDGKALAVRLKEAREYLNLSQQFVSGQTGIPRSAISDIERGARRVESIELKRLAVLYRIPVDYLLGVEPDPEQPDDDPTVRALARAAGDMDDQARKEVLRFAMFLRTFRPGGDAS